MMSTDYQIHRPAENRRHRELQRAAAADQRGAQLRTAYLVVAANVAGAALLIWSLA